MTEQADDEVDRLAARVRQVEPRMTDTSRSRGALELTQRLARESRSQSAARVPSAHDTRVQRFMRCWPLVVGGAALAAAAIALAILPTQVPHVGSQEPGRLAGAKDHAPLMAARNNPPPRAPAPPAGKLTLFYPYSSGQSGPPSPTSVADAGESHLENTGTQDRFALLADCGRIALHGPGNVEVQQVDDTSMVLRLERGTLLVSFDHASGRSLVVKTGDAAVHVTGTVFSVRSSQGPTVVYVWRGSVEVTTTGLPISVTQGKSWVVGAATLAPLDGSSVHGLRDFLRNGEIKKQALAAVPPERKQIAADDRSASAAQALTVAAEEVPASETAPPVDMTTKPSPPLTAESLYRMAEDALAAGRVGEGKKFLAQIVSAYPDDPLLGPAEYELGRLAFVAKDFSEAREQLARVRDSGQSATARFREPAAFLVCRSEIELNHRQSASSCFERYRVDFPHSPHAADALALLAAQNYRDHGCAQARRLFDEYLARFPNGSYAREARAGHERCKQ